MTVVARLGFVLLGVHGILVSLRGISYFVRNASLNAPADPNEFLSFLTVSALVFDLVPPVLLIWFSERLALLVCPANHPSSLEPTATTVLSAGVSVLGVYVAGLGAAGLIGAGVSVSVSSMFLENPAFREQFFSGLGESTFLTLFGLFLFFFGPRIIVSPGASSPAA